jgi:hypothetical protein
VPWLPIYVYGDDPDTLLAILNDDPEAAFIVADGVGQWKAVKTVSALTEKRYTIWHVPSGPLPLLPATHGSPDDQIVDPWAGWTERRAGADPTSPYFGPGHPGIFWLNLKNHSRADEQTVGLSSFEWIGHRYAKVGCSVEPMTDKWWKKLTKAIKRSSSKVPRGGPSGTFAPEVYALPGAIQAFAEGRKADDNP